MCGGCEGADVRYGGRWGQREFHKLHERSSALQCRQVGVGGGESMCGEGVWGEFRAEVCGVRVDRCRPVPNGKLEQMAKLQINCFYPTRLFDTVERFVSLTGSNVHTYICFTVIRISTLLVCVHHCQCRWRSSSVRLVSRRSASASPRLNHWRRQQQRSSRHTSIVARLRLLLLRRRGCGLRRWPRQLRRSRCSGAGTRRRRIGGGRWVWEVWGCVGGGGVGGSKGRDPRSAGERRLAAAAAALAFLPPPDAPPQIHTHRPYLVARCLTPLLLLLHRPAPSHASPCDPTSPPHRPYQVVRLAHFLGPLLLHLLLDRRQSPLTRCEQCGVGATLCEIILLAGSQPWCASVIRCLITFIISTFLDCVLCRHPLRPAA